MATKGWYEYETLDGVARSVRVSEVAAVRQDFWRHRAGGSDEFTKLVSRTGAVLARVPKDYAVVMAELGEVA